eukprot:4073100-Pyramimonas_sp.AAC.1
MGVTGLTLDSVASRMQFSSGWLASGSLAGLVKIVVLIRNTCSVMGRVRLKKAWKYTIFCYKWVTVSSSTFHEDAEETDSLSMPKKPRVMWSVELHQGFVDAVNQLGIDSTFLLHSRITTIRNHQNSQIVERLRVNESTFEILYTHVMLPLRVMGQITRWIP